jgi:hypothetical protein
MDHFIAFMPTYINFSKSLENKKSTINIFFLETLKDNLNLKDNLKEIKPSGHQVVKTSILIFPRILK